MGHLDKYRIYGYHCDPKKNKPDNRVPLVIDQPEFLLEKRNWITIAANLFNIPPYFHFEIAEKY
jgi:hypothetical protein